MPHPRYRHPRLSATNLACALIMISTGSACKMAEPCKSCDRRYGSTAELADKPTEPRQQDDQRNQADRVDNCWKLAPATFACDDLDAWARLDRSCTDPDIVEQLVAIGAACRSNEPDPRCRNKRCQ